MKGPSIYDAAGNRVALGNSLGRGGEGEVFLLTGNPQSVAKVYHTPPDRLRAEKILAMAAAARPELLTVAAWPTATLHSGRGGPLAGLVMPRVAAMRELHVLYSPAQRRHEFPAAGWDFLVHVAANVARAFATVHAAGHILGDVNQKNVVVGQDGKVRLIDCDSFQVSLNGRLFLCEVGVPDFTPPELHGKSFAGIVRTQDHDRFGLAVLIFHLLFMGRHPFVGVFRAGTGDMPMERAIKEGRYAYGRDAHRWEMAAPPHSVAPAVAATPRLVAMFEQAFTQPDRPTAADWVDAVDALRRSLRRCGTHRGHLHAGTTCPWCAVEQKGGPDFFIALASQAVDDGSPFDFEALRRRAAQIPTVIPLLPPSLLAPRSKVGIPTVPTRDGRWGAASVACYLGTVATFGLSFVSGGWLVLTVVLLVVAVAFGRRAVNTPAARALAQELAKAREALKAKGAAFERDVVAPLRKVSGLLAEFDTPQRAYREIPAEHQRAKHQLIAQQRQLQLQHHLERFYIQNARVEGLGPGLKQTLIAWGIESAADVTRTAVGRVSGFGPARTRALVQWRQSIEARFVFDPRRGLDPADVAAVDRKFAVKRRSLEGEMLRMLVEMEHLAADAERARNRLLLEVHRASEAVSVAQARIGMVG